MEKEKVWPVSSWPDATADTTAVGATVTGEYEVLTSFADGQKLSTAFAFDAKTLISVPGLLSYLNPFYFVSESQSLSHRGVETHFFHSRLMYREFSGTSD